MAVHQLVRGSRRLFLGQNTGQQSAFVSPITTGILLLIDIPGGNSYSDTTRITPAIAAGTVVLGVRDTSGNDRHWTQTNASVAPTFETGPGGQPVLRFVNDGAHYMTYTQMTTIRTVYWVINETVGAGNNYRFLLGDSGAYDFHSGANHECFNGSAVSALRIDKTGVALTANRPTTLQVMSATTSRNCVSNDFSRDRNNAYGARSWGGDLAMLICFNAVHDASQIDTMETALKNYCMV